MEAASCRQEDLSYLGLSLRHLEFVSHTTLPPISLGAWCKGGQTSLPGLSGGWVGGSDRAATDRPSRVEQNLWGVNRLQGPRQGELLGHLPGTQAGQAAYGGSRGTLGTGQGGGLSFYHWELAGHAILGARVRPEHGLRFWGKSSILRPQRSARECGDR